MFYADYFIFMLPALILSLIAQVMVSSTFAKYQNIPSLRALTGRDAAREILKRSSITDVDVVKTAGKLTDHYDPKDDIIRLSEGVYDSTSIGAIGVAAHEAGHATQYSDGYFPIKIRSAIIPVCQLGSRVSPYLLLLGMVFANENLFLAGIIAFSTVALFQLVTLPVEFNASRRAISALSQSSILSPDELKGAKKVLTAAAMTYVAALLTSFMQILFYMSRMRRRN